jgi:hypothetical protein
LYEQCFQTGYNAKLRAVEFLSESILNTNYFSEEYERKMGLSCFRSRDSQTPRWTGDG